MQAGFVGLAQSGKTTLFSAVSGQPYGQAALAAASHERPPMAVVKVPDPRLAFLRKMENAPKITQATVDVLDLPSVGDELSDAQNRRAFAAMRDPDVLVHIVRAFESSAGKPADPAGDIEAFTAELLLGDQMQVESRIERIEKALTKPNIDHKALTEELALQQRCLDCLNRERPLTEAITKEAEAAVVRSFAFLTLRPLVRVINIDEGRIGDADTVAAAHADRAAASLAVCGKIESELAELDGDERAEFMVDLELTETAAERLIRACYAATDSITFLTSGPKEARAWPIKRGTHAVTAAGRIHTDLARGFIRAETVAYAHLFAAGDMKAAKAAGHVRLEGKEYVIQEGDVILFRFNV